MPRGDDARELPLESDPQIVASSSSGEQPTAMLLRECQERRRKINRLHEQIATLSAENASQEKLSSSMSDQLHVLTEDLHLSAAFKAEEEVVSNASVRQAEYERRFEQTIRWVVERSLEEDVQATSARAASRPVRVLFCPNGEEADMARSIGVLRVAQGQRFRDLRANAAVYFGEVQRRSLVSSATLHAALTEHPSAAAPRRWRRAARSRTNGTLTGLWTWKRCARSIGIVTSR